MAKVDIFKKIPELDYTEPAPEINTEEFIKVVESRRSVRVYTEENIPEEIMQKCLDLALLAPNSSNLQAWEFYWVKDQSKKEKLVKYCLSQPAARTAAELVVAVARTDTWAKRSKEMIEILQENSPKPPKAAMQYYKKIVPLAYNQGPLNIFGYIKQIVVALRGLKTPTPREPGSESDMKVWAHKSTALACENLMLAFRAFGYDSCPMEGMDSKRVKKLLGLPSKAYITMVISAGKRASNGVYGPRIRFNRDKFIKTI